MFAARDAFFLDAGTTSSRVVAGIGDAGRPGSSRSCGTTVSDKITSAVFSTHLVQSPSGALEKILAPHFQQILITLIIVRVAPQSPVVLRKILPYVTPACTECFLHQRPPSK